MFTKLKKEEYNIVLELYEAIPGDGKKFYTIEGGSHNYLQD